MTDLCEPLVRSRAPASQPLSAEEATDRAAARPEVLVVGPRADARGGIASVQYLLERHAGELADLTMVQTHRDGPAATRVATMVVGLGQAARRLARTRPAVVHLHVSQRASVLRKGVLGLLARRRGVPVVLHLHGSQFLDWFDALSVPARAGVRALLRPHRAVVLSESHRIAYLERIGAAPEHVLALPNPVEWPARLQRDPGGTGTEADTVTAVFLGRFGARKGIYDLVDACARLAPEHRRRLRVVAAGDGEVDGVRAAVAAAGLDEVVDVRGWLDRTERDALLRRAALLVLPSSHEGLPMAVLEAMAFGLVPVVTPVGGLPEVVVDGVNGAMVPVGDPAGLAETLAGLLDDDDRRTALGDRARADARRYSADRWAARLRDVWDGAARDAV